MWSAIYYASIDGIDQAAVKSEIRSNMLWNLQTWSEDLIDWPNDNSKRNDVVYESLPPFPVNERRRQYRWNANPYLVDPLGGTWMMESDPGA